MMADFADRTVLVTGSGTGIGRAIAKEFVSNGASVIIMGRRKEPLEETATELRSIASEAGCGGTVKVFDGVDVSDQNSVDSMIDSLKGSGVVLDILVNNAGVSGPVKSFAASGPIEFQSAVSIHLTGAFWVSRRALDIMKEGSKIITITTFFAEERPLEQRPYRFRSPYTTSQGAKNRLAEALSWELTQKDIMSIATNPGPVHSDRIYKTVYPRAAAEFLRISGFESLAPKEVDEASQDLTALLGQDDDKVKEGIARTADRLAGSRDKAEFADILTRLLQKIREIAEKIQVNTSRMIADGQFLSQQEVAQTVLRLADDKLARILNGRVVPGDRVFYPVKPHVGAVAPAAPPYNFDGGCTVFTVDFTSDRDLARLDSMVSRIEANGGRPVCLVSENVPKEISEQIIKKYHSHVTNISDPDIMSRWLRTASAKVGKVKCVIHVTGQVDHTLRLTKLDRAQWDRLVSQFIITPSIVARQAIDYFAPGAIEDPRLYKDVEGRVVIIGPDLPSGKISGAERARIEVFRGALRPFTATVNQELADVLGSKIRLFTILPGTVTGAQADDGRISDALDFVLSDGGASSAEVILCVDETR